MDALALQADEVQVWQFSIRRVTLEAVAPFLDQEEARRASRYRRPEDQLRTALGWAAARRVLGAALLRPPEELRFSRRCRHCGHAEHGKPRLLDGGAIDFNLSHSGDFVLLAVASDRLVGVDVERIAGGPGPVEILRWLGPDAAAPEAPDERSLLRRWTAAEARLKMTGRGLADLPLAPEPLPSCVTASLPLDTGHVAAAAASPGPCQFRLIAGDHLFT